MVKGSMSPWSIWDDVLKKWLWQAEDPLVPKWEFPNRSGIVPLVASDDPYIKHVESFTTIRAALATYIRSNNTLAGATPVTFTIDAQPDVPRNITFHFDSHAQITAYTITITGTNAKGVTVSETFTQAVSPWDFATVNAFATITSIILTARTGTGVGDTCDVGIGSLLGLANNIDAAADVYKCSKVVIAVAPPAIDYSGAANITPDATYDTVDVSTGAAIVDNDCYTFWYKSRFLNQA